MAKKRNRKRKPTLAQCLVGVAATGMPQPVRTVLESRLGALATMIVAPVLVVTGVVSIQWNGGLPRVSIDRQRAKELEARAVDSLQKLREQDNRLLSLRPESTDPQEVDEPASPNNAYPIANLREILDSLR